MRYPYLLLSLSIIFSFGCKKADNTGGDITKIATDSITQPLVVSGTPKLLNFRINGAQCAFDSVSRMYYYPVSPGAILQNYSVAFDSTAAAAVYINGKKLSSGDGLSYPLQVNQDVEVRVINSTNTTIIYNLVITGMPVVIINTKNHSNYIDETRQDASMDLIDPDYALHKTTLQTWSDISINTRGASALNMPKKAYTVHTVDASDNDRNVPLLGLRNDEDWILDAMAVDPARMRNRLCTDLWNSFNNVPYIADEPTALNGTRGYMTEIFLNGRYHGLYCLTEKLDRKQLKVKKQYGAVYKADESTPQSNFFSFAPFDNTLSTWNGWELSYPDLGDIPAPNWGYLADVTQFIATASDADFTAHIADRVDINNMVDYFIFMNVTYATDNQAKNTFFSFYDYRTNGKFFYSPWDLDGTMGRNWAGTAVQNTITGAGTNYLFTRLLGLDAANFKELVKTRWNALKANQLSKPIVSGLIEHYRNLMVNTGAFEREFGLAAYNQLETSETQYMAGWYSNQYDLVDGYINKL